MGMDTENGRPAPFPAAIATTIDEFGQAHQHLENLMKQVEKLASIEIIFFGFGPPLC